MYCNGGWKLGGYRCRCSRVEVGCVWVDDTGVGCNGVSDGVVCHTCVVDDVRRVSGRVLLLFV